MKRYEWIRWAAGPLLPPFAARVRRDVARLVRESGAGCRVLDVGGRRSPYTVGVPARVTVLDMPREGEVRETLRLGMTDAIEERLARTRSNIERVVLQDMIHCDLPDGSFDGVVCVEVVEHVVEIEPFLDQVARVIAPGGWAYFTTPNGDYLRGDAARWNPDHVRHFRRAELAALLADRFDRVDVGYAVRTGALRVRGQAPYSLRRPFRTGVAIVANLLNRVRSRGVDERAEGTAHLIAIARKAGPR